MRRLQRAHELTTSAIEALNSLYAAPSGSGRGRASALAPCSTRVAEVHKYLFDCCYEFAATPQSSDECASHRSFDYEAEGEAYDDFDVSGATDLISDLVALPADGGMFPVADYVGPELAAYAYAEPPACNPDDLARQLSARLARSCHRVSPAEYAKLVARMYKAKMADLFPSPAEFILGLFGVWKILGESQRMLVDARPPNCMFGTPPFVHTGGDSLSRMQVDEGNELEVAKADLKNFYHVCAAPPPLQPFLGLRRVKASLLRAAGVDVPHSRVDRRGYCWPRLATIPMGWGPAPGVCQGGHEAILYGEKGDGSDTARALEPVLDPAARWSSVRVPELDTAAAAAPHALIVDDLLLFRQRKRRRRRRRAQQQTVGPAGPAASDGDSRLYDACARYAEVGLEAHPDKIHDFSTEQDLLGYHLERNILRAQTGRYDNLRAWVRDLERRGWALPREVEKVVGKLTHIFLLHRFALSVFAAVYAFAKKCGHRRARLWPSVLRELRLAIALVPLVRSDLSRPVADMLNKQTPVATARGSSTRVTCRTTISAANVCGHVPSRATRTTSGRCSARGVQSSKRRRIRRLGALLFAVAYGGPLDWLISTTRSSGQRSMRYVGRAAHRELDGAAWSWNPILRLRWALSGRGAPQSGRCYGIADVWRLSPWQNS